MYQSGVNVWFCRDVLDSKMPLNPGVSHTWVRSCFVPDDNQAQYIALIEQEAVSEDGDWDGISILAPGGPQHVAAGCSLAGSSRQVQDWSLQCVK